MIATLSDRLARQGSLRVDEFVELALYDPDGGFFATGGGAGRAGADFLTSPEVGPLFGAVVARYLDRRWEELGRPDPFVVVEAAAGRGALAIAVLAAAPRCAASLRYVLVERSAALRTRQAEHLRLVHPFEVLDAGTTGDDRGPLVCSLEELPAQPVTGVVLANELLDNLPFRLLERTANGWEEVRVAPAASPAGRPGPGDGALAELLVPAEPDLAARAERWCPDAAPGARIPVQDAARDWLRAALDVVHRGSVLVVDYGATTAELARRPVGEWLRTYRGHGPGGHWLDRPGTQDVTVEVAVDQLSSVAEPSARTTQAAWLRAHGIDELVEEGRRRWAASATAPDLDALRARSRAVEAEALTDHGGLGAFEVLEWVRT